MNTNKDISTVVHQLRTPLSNIRWNLELLIDGTFGKLPKEANNTLKRTHENSLQMIKLIDDLSK